MQLRLTLHLNVAACGLRATDVFGATRYDDTIAHATRALEADPKNVKALFRRGQAHLLRPGHINGLALALEARNAAPRRACAALRGLDPPCARAAGLAPRRRA